MRQKIYLLAIIAASVTLASCSYVRGEKSFLSSRNLDYHNSESAVVLKVPPALHDNEIDDAYYIPPINNDLSSEHVSLLPPGSLAEQTEELETLKKQIEEDANE